MCSHTTLLARGKARGGGSQERRQISAVEYDYAYALRTGDASGEAAYARAQASFIDCE